MIDSRKVKDTVISFGADLCGIASVDRFNSAPIGYRPPDVFPACKSVIAFGCRFPVGTLISKSPTPYTHVRNNITPKMDMIALNLCAELEKYGIVSVPITTNESQWDSSTGRWRSIVSLKHAAQAAGLGTIGRHSLLLTPEFGSMIWLGAVLTSELLEADELKSDICENCNSCVEACPVNALEKPELDQQKFWDYAFGDIEDIQTWNITCHKCRDVCPHLLGTENSLICL